MVRLQDDFYDYVNGEWAETAVIPDDKPSTGGFMDLIQDIENLMLDITGKWQRGEWWQILMREKQLVWRQSCL